MRKPIDQKANESMENCGESLASRSLSPQEQAEVPAALRYQLVFWDFNGTLLDDLQYAIDVRNRVFPPFGLPPIESVEAYHQQFTFPVQVYYQRAGVSDEHFVEVAHGWMDEYVRGCGQVPLHGDVVQTLQAFRSAGLRQVVLSASDHDILKKQLAQYGIQCYFDAVLALHHIYATSKEQIGRAYLDTCGFSAKQCVMLGDTLHDAEVAKGLDIDCILVARGHQSRETLLQADVPVAKTLLEAAALVLGSPAET